MTIRALELFCGIGGFAAAVAGSNVRIVAALDQNPAALNVYRHNFPEHPVRQTDLERIRAWELTTPAANLWWLSPPCQPYCERGTRRDLGDPRARSLVRLMELLEAIPGGKLPEHLALENVAGFALSEARQRLLPLLEKRISNLGAAPLPDRIGGAVATAALLPPRLLNGFHPLGM